MIGRSGAEWNIVQYVVVLYRLQVEMIWFSTDNIESSHPSIHAPIKAQGDVLRSRAHDC